jgi:hypothetical protein
MLNWINFLHIYQPPCQQEEIFRRVARESYAQIARFFDLYDGLRLTMNISGALLEQLRAYGYDALLEDFRRAFAAGELELVGSAMYHPILPLLPDALIERQILLDEEIKQEIFGPAYVRRGFYLPEMAYSRRVGEVLDRMGFEWIILDEIAAPGGPGKSAKDGVYRLQGLRLKVIFRDRALSNCFVPERLGELAASLPADTTVITATDGELYGHRHQDFYNKTKEAFTHARIRSWQAGEFIAARGEELPSVDPLTSSWETTEADLAAGIPFPYWDHPQNELQRRLWDFAAFVTEELERSRHDGNYGVAHAFLDKGLASCHFWAVSGRKSAVWQDLVWNPDIAESGNLFLVKAVRSLFVASTAARLRAEDHYAGINRLIWEWHWKKFYHS